MERTWKPKLAGILTIIAGTVEVVGPVILLGMGLIRVAPDFGDAAGLVGMLLLFLFPIGLLLGFLGIIAIAGGICALKRKVWGLALAGAICTLPIVIMGIPSIVLLAMARPEFESEAKPIGGSGVSPKCGAPTTPQTEICTSCGTRAVEATEGKTWKPIVAGILAIVAGAAQVVGGLSLTGSSVEQSVSGPDLSFLWLPLVLLMVFFGVLLGTIAILGGIYALKRRRWGLALAGAICALPVVIIGIPGIVLLVMARREFK